MQQQKILEISSGANKLGMIGKPIHLLVDSGQSEIDLRFTITVALTQSQEKHKKFLILAFYKKGSFFQLSRGELAENKIAFQNLH